MASKGWSPAVVPTPGAHRGSRHRTLVRRQECSARHQRAGRRRHANSFDSCRGRTKERSRRQSGNEHQPRRGRPAARELSAAEKALQQELTHTLEGRCDVLVRAAPPETRQSDAPMVIDCLRRLDDTVIRQPPIAAQRALAVAKNPKSGTAELVAIFEQDPALTEALLQMANSNFYYRGDEPCVAISKGIQGVGVRGVEAIVTTNMVEGLMCRPAS